MTELSTTLERVRETLLPAFEADLLRGPAKRRPRWLVAAFAAVAITGGAVAVADDWVGPSAPEETQRLFFGTAWDNDVAPVGPVIEAARDERHALFAAPANGGGYCTAVSDRSATGELDETSGVHCKAAPRPAPGEIKFFGSGNIENPQAADFAECEDDPSPEAEQSCAYPPGLDHDFVDKYVIGQLNSDRATRIEIQLSHGLPAASATIGVDGLFVVDLPDGYGFLVKLGVGESPGPAVAYDGSGRVVATSTRS